MKKRFFLCLLLITASLLCSCSDQKYTSERTPSNTEGATDSKTTPSEPKQQEKELITIVNGTIVDVAWEYNETVTELLDLAKNKAITVYTTIYGGFEQVGSLPQSFPKKDVQMTTEPGDVVLYSGNPLVVFFGSNTWSYTKLGHINLAAERLAELLGSESAVIEIKYE